MFVCWYYYRVSGVSWRITDRSII